MRFGSSRRSSGNRQRSYTRLVIRPMYKRRGRRSVRPNACWAGSRNRRSRTASARWCGGITITASGRGMSQQGDTHPIPRSDRFLLWTLTLLLLFTPLAFGTVEVWSIAVAELLMLSMGVVWLAQMIRNGRIQFDQTPFTIPILSFLALMLFQMVPLPLNTIALLSPAAYSVYSAAASALDLQFEWRTISLNPIATCEEFLRVLTYAMLFWVVLTCFRTRERVERVIVTIIGIGFFLAVFAIIQKYSSNGRIYWIRETAQGGEPFGPYVNRNHFAGYMEIALPLTIGYILAQSAVHTHRLGIRRRLLLWTSHQTSKSILLLFAAIFMGAALLLTGSRGGLVSFAGSMVFFVIMAIMKQTAHSRAVRLALACCGLTLVAPIWIGGNSAFLSLERLEKTLQEPSTDERALLWRDTLRMANDYLRLGSGFNTFEEVFPAYKTSTTQMIFQYAHNDYLQLLAEGGIVAFSLIGWFIVAWYRKVIARWLTRHDPFAVYNKFVRPEITAEDCADLRASLGILPDETMLLSLSRIAEEKNIQSIVKHLATIRDQVKVKLVIVGSGPYTDKLQKLVSDLALDDIVIFTGLVDNSQTAYYYKAADFFISASTSETQGLTYIEALASGTHVLAADNAYLRTLITDPAFGCLFEDDTHIPDTILKAISTTPAFDQAKYNQKLYAISAECFAARVYEFYLDKIISNNHYLAQKGESIPRQTARLFRQAPAKTVKSVVRKQKKVAYFAKKAIKHAKILKKYGKIKLK